MLQKYVKRHTKSAINEHVEERSRSTDILGSVQQSEVPLFQRREIRCGNLIGGGTFSNVYEITQFKLKALGPNGSPVMEGARLSLSLDTEHFRKSTGTCKYVIKQPKQPSGRQFVEMRRDSAKFEGYTRAAIDVIMEARYLSKFDHPNIIKVRGLSSDASPFLVLDRLDETLEMRIIRWRQEAKTGTATVADSGALLRTKADYALQMAKAIKYLHDRRIIVRDLKPSNLGFKTGDNGTEVLQLFDFGLCRELPQPVEGGGASFLMSLAGTIRYMAVEILNTRTYGLAADVYSWSIVFFEMMTLEVAFGNFNRSAANHRRFVCREGERPIFPQSPAVPSDLQALIRNTWAQDASDRLDMTAVCDRLQKITDNAFHQLPASPLTTETGPITLKKVAASTPPAFSLIASSSTTRSSPAFAKTGAPILSYALPKTRLTSERGLPQIPRAG